MRVTQGMLSNNMLNNLMNSQVKMDKYLEQLYTGKKISRPSDDPVIAMKGINYRSELAKVEQFKRNTGEVNNWMDNSDAALDNATKAMHRLRDLAVKAGNAAYGDEELQSIKAEAEQIKLDLIDIANTRVNDKYIFNGTDTDTKPVIANAAGDITTPINQNDTPVMIEVSSGTKLQANVDGKAIFNDEFFAAIDNFINSLDGGGADGDSVDIDGALESIDEHTGNIINARADLGARMNRLELIESRLADQEIIATRTMANNENIDFEVAITNLITQESLHRAALSAGSRVIQPSLIDFLR